MSKITPFENYKSNVEIAKNIASFTDEEVKTFLNPYNEISKTLNVEMDDGSIKELSAFRMQFNNARGPYKGGIRFHPEANKDEVMTLAALMALKCATVNIPLGGGKGGVQVNTKELSTKEVERVSRAWVRAMAEDIGVNKDIPAPDVATNPQTMAWMLDEFESIKKQNEPGVFTGKPIELGGSLGRTEATGYGGIMILEEYVKENNLDRENTKVAIQGFGNVGFYAAKKLHSLGYKVVAVSDSRGGVYNPEGLNPEDVMNSKKEHGRVQSYESAGTTNVSNEELLLLPCNVLIPAALDGQIHKNNASEVKASVVLELANGPTTQEADAILESKGIHVIPDILANAGGVTVSYFEWVQNRQQLYWELNDVNERLQKIMSQAYSEVSKLRRDYSTSFRAAAFILSMKRIMIAEKLRGK